MPTLLDQDLKDLFDNLDGISKEFEEMEHDLRFLLEEMRTSVLGREIFLAMDSPDPKKYMRDLSAEAI
jgi:hypothetical protein